MAEFILSEDAHRVEYVRPDESGFTIRTRYKDTSEVIEEAKMLRADTSKSFKDARGVTQYHVGKVPLEVYEMWTRKLGREPTAEECIKFLQDRDFSDLRTRDVKL